MTFTGNEGDSITLTQATTWVANYRAANPTATKGHFFGCNRLNAILTQTNCVGIKMYHAMDDTGQAQLVLIGVDANGCDLTNGLILDKSVLCPPYCDTKSPLCK